MIRGVWTVKLIDETGSQVGNIPFREALKIASDKGFDLVEVGPTNDPPICKLMNFGQYKYEQKKKLKGKVRVQPESITKEIGLTPNTSPHDLEVKANYIKGWLEEKHKVMVKVKFAGRELQHSSLGFAQMTKLTSVLPKELFVVETPPVLNGKFMTMLLKANS